MYWEKRDGCRREATERRSCRRINVKMLREREKAGTLRAEGNSMTMEGDSGMSGQNNRE